MGGGVGVRSGCVTRVGCRPERSRGDLAGDHRGQRHAESDQLDGAEGLAQQERSQRCRDQGREESQGGNRRDREAGDAAEPQCVGRESADEAEPETAGRSCGVDGRGQALVQQRDREDEQPSSGELPPGQGHRRDPGGPPPLLGEGDAEPHRHRAQQPGGHAHPVKGRGGAQHHQGHPDDPHDPPGEAPRGERLPQDDHDEDRHDQRLCRPEGCSDTPGQAVGRDEQQWEEDADVEHSQHRRPPPPGPCRQRTRQRDGEHAGRQCPHQRGEEGVSGRQQLGRDDVRRSPHQWRTRGDQGGPQRVHGNSLTLNCSTLRRVR